MSCHGKRLKKEMLSVTIQEKSIIDVTEMSIENFLHFITHIPLSGSQEIIAKPILKELKERAEFLVNVGLKYLTLDRSAATLSGGESQRIRLATQIGSKLTGVLYVLDEPSIGLHQSDNNKLIAMLKNLRDLGNTVIVVEHDEDTILQADYVIDVGPGAGRHGGNIVATGTPEEIKKNKNSLTGLYLAGEKKIDVPQKRRSSNGKQLVIHGATEHNLKNIDVAFPLGCYIAVTGVSGSGKSTLVNDILVAVLENKLNHAHTYPGQYKDITGIEYLDKIINIDQSPIGRTPRSNPATYTGVFTDIRELFAATPESRIRGYKSGRYSFNVKGGRCEACQGDGLKKIEMYFLPDVYVNCEVCHGKRYNEETLQITYRGKNIAEVLDMTVDEAYEFFKAVPSIEHKLKTLQEVGLGYIKLGQSATTLSGGEAQRIKLSTELARRATGKTLYVLDEPTTGLHFDDVSKLIRVLDWLVEKGNTVIVIEHNLDVIKSVDYIIDLGPEGGDNGGRIVATGTPEEVARCPQSQTGKWLKKVLEK
jgi:excinuclease ABC subunit A